jgi:hypothetical protein
MIPEVESSLPLATSVHREQTDAIIISNIRFFVIFFANFYEPTKPFNFYE